ncbi:MAG: flagellar hook-length control protein FliK [Phycisphaeraceae bacterium]|nr:flagellar hook-length control protein FliK [Phycisphaeraceae bacterium]
MMNAQILAKTLVPSGPNAQSIQGKQSGSNSSRIHETRQDASDPTAKTVTISDNAQDGKQETSADPKGFKNALDEKMAKPEQEQPPEEPLTESPPPTDATLQETVAQGQVPVQVPVAPEGTLNQTILDVLDVPIQEIPGVKQGESQPSAQITMQNSGTNELLTQTEVVQVSEDLPVTSLKEPTKIQAPVLPISLAPAPSSAQPVDPTLMQDSSSTQNMEVVQAQTDASAAPLTSVQTPELSVTPKDAQTTAEPTAQATAEPVMQATTQSEGPSSEQDPNQRASQADLPKETAPSPERTEIAQSQPDAPSQPERQTSPVIPAVKPAPTSEIQSMPQETQAKAETVNTSPVEQTPQTDAPEPIQVTRPVQQAFTAMIEPSQGQPADTSETTAALESAQSTSTTPVLSPLETQAASTVSEVALPRTLDPAPTSVARQIQNSIALGVQQNSNQIVIRLDPPELGRVAIRFEESSQGITGMLEVQKSQTRHDIQQALPQIILQLQDSGVQIKRVEVVLSADADAETFEDKAFAQTQDQNLEHQQNSEQNKAQRNPAYSWSSSSNQGAGHQAQEQYVSDQGINLLI